MPGIKTKLFDRLTHRGAQFLGTRYPLICGAMTWISNPHLVAAMASAGGFGCLAAANMPSSQLEELIDETRRLTDKPFGVNLLTIAPAYHEQLHLCQWKKVPFVIFAASFPKKYEIKMVKESGSKVICYAPTYMIARQMERYGADALFLEGCEAGGHVNRVSLDVLLQQILFKGLDIPAFVGGGIATGKICAQMLLMGAAGIVMGTRFAASKESCAHPAFKARLIKAKSRDAVAIPQFDSRLPVVATRILRNKSLGKFYQLQEKLIKRLNEGKTSPVEARKIVERYWIQALRLGVIDGNVEHGALMAGQGVGLINKIKPVRQIIADIVLETEDELQRLRRALQ